MTYYTIPSDSRRNALWRKLLAPPSRWSRFLNWRFIPWPM